MVLLDLGGNGGQVMVEVYVQGGDWAADLKFIPHETRFFSGDPNQFNDGQLGTVVSRTGATVYLQNDDGGDVYPMHACDDGIYWHEEYSLEEAKVVFARRAAAGTYLLAPSDRRFFVMYRKFTDEVLFFKVAVDGRDSGYKQKVGSKNWRGLGFYEDGACAPFRFAPIQPVEDDSDVSDDDEDDETIRRRRFLGTVQAFCHEGTVTKKSSGNKRRAPTNDVLARGAESALAMPEKKKETRLRGIGAKVGTGSEYGCYY